MLRHILLIAWYYLHGFEQNSVEAFFLHMLRRKMWVTAGMRLFCVYANRKMAMVLTNFLAMFPFVTCVKESENQPNGFVESHRKSQPSPFQKVKA